MCTWEETLDKLSQKQLSRLYFDYVEYRDSLPLSANPVGIKEYFEQEKHRYI